MYIWDVPRFRLSQLRTYKNFSMESAEVSRIFSFPCSLLDTAMPLCLKERKKKITKETSGKTERCSSPKIYAKRKTKNARRDNPCWGRNKKKTNKKLGF